MRMCPVCGFIDSSYWRHSGFNRWYDFTELPNFREMEPEIANRLLSEKVVVEKGIIYNLSKGGYVYRRYEIDGFSKTNFHSTAEKRKPGISPNQLRLVSSENKTGVT